MVWLLIVAPSAFVVAVVAAILAAGAKLAARRAARRAADTVERAESADEAGSHVERVRGRLVVDGAGSVSNVRWSAAERCAASASGAAEPRLWWRRGPFVAAARAERLWIDTGAARVRLDGPVALAMGSRVSLHAGEVALFDGDDVVAVGMRRRDPASPPDEALDYRDAAGTQVLFAPPGESIRVAAARAPRLSGMWRLLVLHPAMWAAYALAGAFVAGLVHFLDHPRRQWHCEVYGECGVALAPPNVWLKDGPFLAVAESDDVCRATLFCTAAGTHSGDAPSKLVHGVLNPPIGVLGEGCQSPCALLGACSARAGHCRAANEADCALTEGCVLWGYCSPTEGGCGPTRDEDCAGSRACRVLGRCRALGGACRSADHIDLGPGDAGVALNRPSDDEVRSVRETVYRCSPEPCGTDGRCDANADGDCVVGGDDDCARSEACLMRGSCKRWGDNQSAECAASCADTSACKESGRCTAIADGLCGAGTERECQESEACRRDGRCTLVDGTCQATAAICASWDGCRFDGRCGVADGACRLTPGACARTIPCAKLGACSPSPLFEGCGVGVDAECAQSEVCARYGWCSAVSLGYLPTMLRTTSHRFCFAKPVR